MSSDVVENLSQAEAAAQQPKVDAQTGSLESGPWLRELEAAHKHRQKFIENGRKIVNRFLDKRDESSDQRHYLNLFTANTEILLATLYSKVPEPVVERRWKDMDDDVARVAALMLERNILIEKRDSFDCAMREVIQDWVLPGHGAIWWRYEPTIVKDKIPAQPPVMAPDGVTELAPAQPEQEFDRLVNEEAISDYVYWEDFIWSPCRTWKLNRWVARRLKFSREDAEARFGAIIAGRMNFNMSALQTQSDDNTTPGQGDPVRYAEVFEMWVKRDRKVRWVQKGVDFCLDVKDDFLNLPDFWPCSKPLLATHATRDLLPTADFLLVQDQYDELDDLTHRITKLEQACKAVGVYDGQNEEIKRIFTEQIDNTIIPTMSFRDFAEKGGFKGLIDWIPIEAFVNAIKILREVRTDCVQQIYEMTGMSDLMRGATKASETLGAQELKAQFGAVRTQNRQIVLATFVEENMEIKAEIVRTKYQPQTIRARSNIDKIKEDVQFVEPALELLRGPMWNYSIEVAPDTMAIPEFNSERDARMLFVRSLAEFLTAAGPLIQQDPGAGIYLLRIIQWASAGFRVGRTIEGVLDEAVKALQKTLSMPKEPPPPDPLVVAKTKEASTKAEDNLASADKKTAEAQQIIAETGIALKTPIEDPNLKNEPRPPTH